MSAVFAFGCSWGRGWRGLEIGFWVSVWRVARAGSGLDLGVLASRTLFDNFIGRKRDVDGGVLAGLFWLQDGEVRRDN